MFDIFTLNYYGILVIQFVQRLPLLGEGWIDQFWMLLTKFGDPKNVVLFYAHFLYPFSKHTAHEFLIAGVVSEYLNMIMKWILMSDRPYWWIHETNGYTNDTRPKLQQFEHTCETGPGNPSGHAMVTSCVWLVFLLNIRSRLNPCLHKLLWALYLAAVVFIAISRLYVAAHFPHQLIFGVLAGISIALLVRRYCRHIDFKECAYIAAVLFVLSSLVLISAQVFNWDLDATIVKAKKWCENPAWIHIATTPYTAMFRNLGALLALGLASDWRSSFQLRHQHLGYSRKIIWSALNVLLAQITTNLVFKITSQHLFYVASLVQSSILTISTTFLVPLSMKNSKLED